ncbi:hypothetical protein SCP_0500300 [Sparassis crispa]|uniref:F-box domain-containing protein n=1 Tax=Sparassis crispa TaxID=139825 RepID=A0A401GLD4_9APHY|nr:hypothetical protein SCP_0500300 [Sparassis crispa]GBE82987.1 hypothetical protein SCP_0500300 [Sparassis crispa]
MMPTLLHLPPEIIEQILLELDPLHIGSLAQSCSDMHSFIYDPADQHLWRSLYLLQPLDDPRQCLTELGYPISEVNWMAKLQRIIRARTVISRPAQCHVEERCTILYTLLDLVSNLPAAPSVFSDDLALNLVWLAALLRGGSYLDEEHWEISDEEKQLRARLHTYFGLTTSDYRSQSRKQSRAYVYAMRHYKWDNDFGPFMMDGSGRVNWVHLQAIHHVMSMHIVPPEQESESEASVFTIFPMSLPYCQSIIPRHLDLDQEEDWAGVAGLWECSFCFCDHHELLLYNNMNISDVDPLQSAIFDDPSFVEVFRTINVELRVISTQRQSDHPSRPMIKFAGEIDDMAIMVGWVKVTSDDQIRWHFNSGENGNAIWGSEGVQVGGIRSTFGVLGAWTTTHHDQQDPVGPFWMRKAHPPSEAEDLDQSTAET